MNGIVPLATLLENAHQAAEQSHREVLATQGAGPNPLCKEGFDMPNNDIQYISKVRAVWRAELRWHVCAADV